MQLAGEYFFDASQETVWEALQDPDVLGAIMPGGEGFEQVSENEYTGTLNVKIGPVQGRFEGAITLSDKVPPESYSITVDGRGGPGFVKASGAIELSEEGPGTRLTYALDAQVGGRIATVGQRLVEAGARSIANQSLESLNVYLAAPVESGAPSEPAASGGAAATGGRRPASAYRPPSQGNVALTVLKDVLGELLPAHRRPIAAAIGAFFVAAILYVVMDR